MGQIIFKYDPRYALLRLTASTVPLTFDGKVPVTFPLDLSSPSLMLSAPKGSATLTFSDLAGPAWQVTVTVPGNGNLMLDVADAEVAAGVDGGSL